VDDDIAALVREQRLTEAGELALKRGQIRVSVDLFERACAFGRAAEVALQMGDAARSLQLALEGEDARTAEQAATRVLADRPAAHGLALRLARRGDHVWAARLYEGLAMPQEAARAFEQGGDAIHAARVLEANGNVKDAARVLEAQRRKVPEDEALSVALASLLLRHGNLEGAVRAAEAVRAQSDLRPRALLILVDAFEHLHMDHARDLAARELAQHGDTAPTAPADLLTPQTVRPRLFGRYEIITEVATSPSARVVECRDTLRDERVAVKLFAAADARGHGRDALLRFEREVHVLRTLQHPNVVQLRDYVAEGPALVLTWMAGGTLRSKLETTRLTPSHAVEITLALLRAVEAAHRHGILHRDIKPSNVLFDDMGVAHLADFGVAHLNEGSVTVTQGVIGTLDYMSPEQREGRPATVQSDLFSVGALLWEMLTGERPAQGAAVASPSAHHRALAATHDALVLSFLAVDPTMRPHDATAAQKALEALTWPDAARHVAASTRPGSVRRAPSEAPPSLRLQRQSDGSDSDVWLQRAVLTLPLDKGTLARASVFARAAHPSLPCVLHVDRQAEVIWVARPKGQRLEGLLSHAQVTSLREALARLHELGEVYGRLERENVWVDEHGRVALAFTPTPEIRVERTADLEALARLEAWR
jgi:serine/threonine-protein kinase